MNLYCASAIEIAMIGSSFLIGCFFGSFIFPRAADIYGRKPVFIAGLVLYIMIVVPLIFCTNVYMAYFLLFIGGIAETGGYYVAYVYAIEWFPKKNQNIAGLTLFLVFAFNKMFYALYFW